ncbi:MAG: OB-fold nucleic acid binding domain-containing protein, partial [Bacteroidia bacterium]|nr:OB-fold nucleic acid binding domain-containing protein [Bacteroidia bacterium]
SLFGSIDNTSDIPEPKIPAAEPWPLMTKLNFERDVIGFYLSGHPLDKYRVEMKTFTTCSISQLEDFQNKEVRIGGIITACSERMTKTGKKFMSFSLEDFTSSLDINLFGEDYVKWRNYIHVNECVFISAHYAPGFRDSNSFEIKVRDIKLLDGLLEKLTKELTIELNLMQLDEPLIDRLDKIFSESKGNCPLRFKVIDPELPANLTFASRSHAVRLASPLLEELDKLSIRYSLR